MKHIIATCALILCGCANGGPIPAWDAPVDAGNSDGPTKELVCAADFCGTIVDKTTGATADCGSCQGYSQCGDNGIANVCGSSCLPLTAPDGDGGLYAITPACNYALGPGWWAGLAPVGEQFPPSCNYINPQWCIEIPIPWPASGGCSDTVCGTWWCCIDDPTNGINPLLPGSVASNDGGLP